MRMREWIRVMRRKVCLVLPQWDRDSEHAGYPFFMQGIHVRRCRWCGRVSIAWRE
jgi:hypothetical protein